MRESVIVGAVRTPTGKFLGALKGFTATQLGALVVAEAVRRAAIDPATVDECIMGNVVSAGLGQSPARQAALRGGLPDHVAALTINKVCGSGLKAVMLADQAIRVGDIDIAVAGGMESMSNCPYLLTRAREGLRMGNGEIVDSMINDGLWCSFENWHMGNAGEVVAEQYCVPRAAQDEYAVESHRRAARATAEGAFADEMLPISIAQKKGDPIVVDRDEGIRADTTIEALAALKPAFKKDGTVTAGNAPPVNDGASALVVMAADRAKSLGLAPLVRIVGQATSGLPPKLVLMTPVEAVRRVAEKVGWKLDGRRSVRAERSVLGAGRRGAPRTRHRRCEGERQRRRRGARPRDRLERRPRADDAHLRAEASKPETRHRDALSRRRQRRGCGCRARVTDSRRARRNRRTI
jgi:acetyl-CoA C-acetyltransferase